MTVQPRQDNGTLVLALIAGLSINGAFDALFSSVVAFSVFPIIALVLAIYCLHVRYQKCEMPLGMPKLAAACFVLGLLLYSTIVRAEYPQLGSNFLPSVICVVLVFWIAYRMKKRKENKA
ncbi:YijD family membrane protein [Rouxiella chamberiensis]|uniref:YijD family membrane protein n=1 Tax=Rouxiella chamberiensis TaxID=1513468 RepID=A0ABY7HNK3_9GAMM|nr:YijD family membrane protein [Rouxiella chamberiensis]WAT00491.1 YijD family membrane protein [Rouxiella chamberiensis]